MDDSQEHAGSKRLLMSLECHGRRGVLRTGGGSHHSTVGGPSPPPADRPEIASAYRCPANGQPGPPCPVVQNPAAGSGTSTTSGCTPPPPPTASHGSTSTDAARLAAPARACCTRTTTVFGASAGRAGGGAGRNGPSVNLGNRAPRIVCDGQVNCSGNSPTKSTVGAPERARPDGRHRLDTQQRRRGRRRRGRPDDECRGRALVAVDAGGGQRQQRLYPVLQPTDHHEGRRFGLDCHRRRRHRISHACHRHHCTCCCQPDGEPRGVLGSGRPTARTEPQLAAAVGWPWRPQQHRRRRRALGRVPRCSCRLRHFTWRCPSH